MNASEIKALGNIWGAQHGLLSIAELELLMVAVSSAPFREVLEVGHYFGLSTCAIVHALQECGGEWSMTTVDAHIPDAWVGLPAAVEAFQANRTAHFDSPNLRVVIDRSQTITGTRADFVFYDGDHADEQLRFTEVIMASPSVRTFLFDDRDFPIPRLCSDRLIQAGWRDASPPSVRLPGDKLNPETQTLAWFSRP